MNTYDLIAMSQAGGEGAEGSGFAGMIPFILIIFIIYFLMIRPQSKKAKAQKQMLTELTKGDKVVTIGGIYGTIVEVRDQTFIIKVSGTTDIEMLKSSVSEQVKEQTLEKKQ
ncbi:MAG: preprotein translocase subunit YajC [Candidatus Delongbacteria bacterium]|jgi:preprotein translocase subunit YajC|nr:preprotein translocase subunit YajC [Candidatus Delongbacteria bacterium]